jgi:DNA processing protein
VEDVQVLLALNRTGLVGPTLLGRLRRAFGERLSSASVKELAGVEGIGEATARAIRRQLDGGGGAAELAAARRAGVRILVPDEFPALLRHTVDPPTVLYVRGELRPEDAMAIAMVGTRHPSDYGRRMAQALARGLAELGVTVVSGLARGIDSTAHLAALEAGGRTIAVVGCGLNHVYPPENKALAARIAQAGAVVSELAMDEPPRPAHFPRRNRIISGLSLGTVCVEASLTSGALVSCAWALEQGREVFAVPGPAGQVLSRGPHRLIRQGAKLVEEVVDIVEELGAFAPILARLRQREPDDPLERVAWAAVRDGADTLDRVCRATGLGPDVCRRLLDTLVRASRLVRSGRTYHVSS